MIPLNSNYPSFYEQTFLLSPIGIALADVDGQWKKANPALCRLLGYEENELLSLDYRLIVHPDDIDQVDRYVRELLTEKTAAEPMEVRYYHKSREIVWVSQYVSRGIEPQDLSAFLSMHFIDITDRKRSEQRLMNSENNQRMLLEHAIDIISFSAPTGICEYISPSIRHLLGYEPEELIGRQQLDLFHPEDAEEIASRHFMDIDKVSCRARHKAGYYVWFETTTKMIRNEQGELQTILGIGRDITERMLTEQALMKSEGNLAEAQKIASIGSWDWDIAGGELVWSEQMLRIFDVHPARLLGKHENLLLQFIHPEDSEYVTTKIEQALEGNPYNLECRIVTPKQREKHVHIQGIVLFDVNGRPEKMHSTVQDITERKKIQQQLEEVVDRYTSLKKYNPDAIISLDLQGYINSVNPAAELMTGYDSEDLLQMHFTDLVYPEDMVQAESVFRLLIQGEPLTCFDLRIIHKDGSSRDLVLTPAPIIIRQQLMGFYFMVKEVTMQKKKDELLRNSEKLSVVGQLAAGVAHEIRNPLTALKGFVKLMLHSDHHVPKYLSIMKDELERIELIVSELLMLSKPQTVHLRRVNLQEMVVEVQALIGTQAIMKNIEIQLSGDADPLFIYCDPNQIKQVIINFMKNSIESMEHEGAISIELARDSTSNQILLRIIDQGCGIPEEQISRLGEPFFTTKEGGTGLGLMISQRIIEHHGGKLMISSRVNVGTTVEVRFPQPKDQLVEHSAVGI